MISFLLRLISIFAWMFFALLVSVLISFLKSSNSVLDVVLGIIVIGSLAALNVLIALKLWRASSPSKNDDAIGKISSPHPAKNVDTQPEPLEEIPLNNEDIVEIHAECINMDEETIRIEDAPLSYLESKILDFLDGKRTDYVIPHYYTETVFGQNVNPCLERFLKEGYLEMSGLDKILSLYTVPDLKAALSEHELKVSGKKQELIQRLLENIPTDELETLFPVGAYQLTTKGMLALSDYSLLRANDAYSMGFSYYRLLNAKEKYKDCNDDEILSFLLAEDMQKCYEEKNMHSYQEILVKVASYMHKIGKFEKALEFYILSYFAWCMETEYFDIPGINLETYYYTAFSIGECGKLCGYSSNDLERCIYNTIINANPFGLGTPNNANRMIDIFRKALSI